MNANEYEFWLLFVIWVNWNASEGTFATVQSLALIEVGSLVVC